MLTSLVVLNLEPSSAGSQHHLQLLAGVCPDLRGLSIRTFFINMISKAC